MSSGGGRMEERNVGLRLSDPPQTVGLLYIHHIKRDALEETHRAI